MSIEPKIKNSNSNAKAEKGQLLPLVFYGAPLILVLFAMFKILLTSLGLDGVWLY